MAFNPVSIRGRSVIPSRVLSDLIGSGGSPLPDFESARSSIRMGEDSDYVGQVSQQELEEHHREHHPDIYQRLVAERRAREAAGLQQPAPRQRPTRPPPVTLGTTSEDVPIRSPGDGSRFEDL
jgi:hypothetical protein